MKARTLAALLIAALLIAGLAIGFDTETTQAEEDRNFVRVDSNNDDLEACLIATIQSRVHGVTVTRDLFDRPAGPYVELIALCEPRKPLIRDRAGRLIATQSLLVCATTVNAFPGRDFWTDLGIDRAATRGLMGLSRRMAVFGSAGTPTGLCEEIGLKAGKQLYHWLAD
jgi:hypothetical protein